MRNLIFATRRLFTTQAIEPQADTAKANATHSRFWKKAEVDTTANGYIITLDGRPLKTPSNNLLEIPSERPLLAALIAHEWDTQERLLKPHSLPMTSLASRALDAFQTRPAREEARRSLLQYFETDTICFHQSHPPRLTTLQDRHWTPILDWARKAYSADIRVSESILPTVQPAATKEALFTVMANMDHWEIAGLERATHATKSFLISLALIKGRLTIQQAADASRVEVESQMQSWGLVEDSHDVDREDTLRQLGSVACLLSSRETR